MKGLIEHSCLLSKKKKNYSLRYKNFKKKISLNAYLNISDAKMIN